MEEPIRVLCVFSWLDRGGAELMCMDLYRHIDRNKVQFDFVKHTSQKGELEDEILSLGGRIYEAPRYLVYNHHQYTKWWKIHLSEHPEHHIIHGHYFSISAVYFKVCKKMGCTTIVHIHSAGMESKGVKNILERWLRRKLDKYSDYRFACGNKAGESVFHVGGYQLIKNGINVESFKPCIDITREVEAEFGLENCFIVGTVGRQTYPKNPMGIVEIIRAIAKKNNNFRFLWVGADYMRREIQEKIEAYKLEKYVIMTGARNDVNRLLQAMDVFILPSIFEGLPVSGIEAQAVGLPCFFSENITREVVLSSDCFFLPLNQPDLWAEKICRFGKCEHKDQTQIVRENGYDVRESARKLQNFYLNVE